jgi:hypothetical protein
MIHRDGDNPKRQSLIANMEEIPQASQIGRVQDSSPAFVTRGLFPCPNNGDNEVAIKLL